MRVFKLKGSLEVRKLLRLPGAERVLAGVTPRPVTGFFRSCRCVRVSSSEETEIFI